MDQNFLHQLIKGKIAELIFRQMFKEADEFTIIPLGYENTLPELAQYQHLAEVKSVLANIKSAPDFVLISKDKKRVFLVEVKYRRSIDKGDLKEIAQKISEHWNPAYLCIMTQDHFYFDTCKCILENEGNIGLLSESWVKQPLQEQYLSELRNFIQ